jgi:crotonobetainyl-CoA:carnitine CoA-transferase CaiB-like acyl-CoA transferase
VKSSLEGIRIVDLTHFVAGPWATSLLGDFGADVIKIERPGVGDGSRHLDRLFGEGRSSYFVGLNRSKRCLALDVHTPDGQEVLHRLLATADVVIANFRPGVMRRLGLSHEQLKEKYPTLIPVSITAYGEDGSLATKPAMDIIIQAEGGVMGLTGEPGRSPVRIGAPIADFVGSYLAFSAVVLGLYVRETQGVAQQIEVNLLDGQVSMLANLMAGYAKTGDPTGPQGSGHSQIVPYQVFETLDQPIVIGCLTEEFWRSFCKTVGREDLVENPYFLTNADRVENREKLIPVLGAILKGKSHADWLREMEANGVPCARISNLQDLIDSEQVARNGMVQTISHPTLGAITVVGNPLHLRATPARSHRYAPSLGEHSKEILEELGYTSKDIDQLMGARSPVATKRTEDSK